MYATRDNMVEQFGEREVIALTDREPMTGEINDAVLTSALTRASSEVDGYLAGRYQTPLPNPQAELVGMVCDIARYRLCGGAVNLTDEITERYNAAIKYLERAAKGLVTLGSPGGADPGPENSVQMVTQPSVFARDRGAY